MRLFIFNASKCLTLEHILARKSTVFNCETDFLRSTYSKQSTTIQNRFFTYFFKTYKHILYKVVPVRAKTEVKIGYKLFSLAQGYYIYQRIIDDFHYYFMKSEK